MLRLRVARENEAGSSRGTVRFIIGPRLFVNRGTYAKRPLFPDWAQKRARRRLCA